MRAPASAAPTPATAASIRMATRSASASPRWPTPAAPGGATSKISRTAIIDRSKTRVLAFLNIVGNGMRGGRFENDLTDMEAAPAAEMALKYKDLIVGIKTAHYTGPEWTPVEHAVEAGNAGEDSGDGGFRRTIIRSARCPIC